MQKLFKTILTGSAYLAVILSMSCGGKDKSPNPVANCGKNAEKVTAAGTDWATDPTNEAKCLAYKAAIKEFYNSCETYYDGAAKKALDDFLKSSCK